MTDVRDKEREQSRDALDLAALGQQLNPSSMQQKY